MYEQFRRQTKGHWFYTRSRPSIFLSLLQFLPISGCRAGFGNVLVSIGSSEKIWSGPTHIGPYAFMPCSRSGCNWIRFIFAWNNSWPAAPGPYDSRARNGLLFIHNFGTTVFRLARAFALHNIVVIGQHIWRQWWMNDWEKRNDGGWWCSSIKWAR